MMTKIQAEARLAEIGPNALKLARETRETIALCQLIRAKETPALVTDLRRNVLEYITQCKKEYRTLRASLDSGVFG